MKNNNKGISLVSLIIIIVATIILISVVVTVGYDYIEESNRAKIEAVVKLIGDAAKDKQDEMHQVDSDPTHYIGYPLKPEGLDKISGLPDNFEIVEGDVWYFIDANSAKELGVVETEKYIEEDLDSPAVSEIPKLVLANYVDGNAYFVEINKMYLDYTIEDSTCNEALGRRHLWTAQTCLRGSYCMACNNPHPTKSAPLGHGYLPATCTSAAICVRCFEIDLTQPAKGHEFELDEVGNEKWSTDAIRHWKECIRCHMRKETASHEKGYIRILASGSSTYDAKHHRELCSICSWESVKTPHEIEYEITGDTSHRRYCVLCEYAEDHFDSGWITDDPEYHWRECDEECPTENGGYIDCIEGGKVFYEKHVDKNKDGICDVCSKILDTTPPNSFNSPGSYVNVTKITTSEIHITAYTQDNYGVMGYKFAIDEEKDGIVNWEEVPLIETENLPGSTIFENLEHNKTYNIYVIALDEAENSTDAYLIQVTTKKVPNVKILESTLPSSYVNSEFEIEFVVDQATLADGLDVSEFSIEHSIDGGNTWINNSKIIIDKEDLEVQARAKDKVPNIGDENKQTITKLDKTAPTVAIKAKQDDDPTVLKTSHTAVITLEDEKAQIGARTTIRYGWSLNKNAQPATYIPIITENTARQETVNLEVTTPEGEIGKYYLWIDKGVKDAVGNETKNAVCSEITFNVDDQDVTLSNIRMYNANPEISGESGFVKTNGTITVTFAAGKALASAPIVKIGGVDVTNITSIDNINWKATIVASSLIPEGTVSLNISGIVTQAGKPSSNTYTQDNLSEGPVIYDATTPSLEYIDK